MKVTLLVDNRWFLVTAAAPCPADWQRSAITRDGVAYRIRPIRPDDAEREREFIRRLSPESLYSRLMYAMREPSNTLIEHLVHVDYLSSMALVAVIGELEEEQIIGVARYGADPSGPSCEFAIAVADAWQSRGIGTSLARLLFDYARAHGFRRIHGTILADNDRMIRLTRWLGLRIEPSPHDATRLTVALDLSIDPVGGGSEA